MLAGILPNILAGLKKEGVSERGLAVEQQRSLWRDNQDENAATIKMRMPRRLTAL